VPHLIFVLSWKPQLAQRWCHPPNGLLWYEYLELKKGVL